MLSVMLGLHQSGGDLSQTDTFDAAGHFSTFFFRLFNGTSVVG